MSTDNDICCLFAHTIESLLRITQDIILHNHCIVQHYSKLMFTSNILGYKKHRHSEMSSETDAFCYRLKVVKLIMGYYRHRVNFLGLLNPLTSEITITTPNNPIYISITGITFDCNGRYIICNYVNADSIIF